MATRAELIRDLKLYAPWNARETEMRDRILAFVEMYPDCFERSLACGHVTGSAWITDLDRSHALLVHHRKLDKWLQPGGHCDGDPRVLEVALREAREETGLQSVRPVSAAIYDVDAHDIPERKGVPAHVHYDIRFLLEADRAEPLRVSEESHDARWVALNEIAQLNTDDSVLRLAAKLEPARR